MNLRKTWPAWVQALLLLPLVSLAAQTAWFGLRTPLAWFLFDAGASTTEVEAFFFWTALSAVAGAVATGIVGLLTGPHAAGALACVVALVALAVGLDQDDPVTTLHVAMGALAGSTAATWAATGSVVSRETPSLRYAAAFAVHTATTGGMVASSIPLTGGAPDPFTLPLLASALGILAFGVGGALWWFGPTPESSPGRQVRALGGTASAAVLLTLFGAPLTIGTSLFWASSSTATSWGPWVVSTAMVLVPAIAGATFIGLELAGQRPRALVLVGVGFALGGLGTALVAVAPPGPVGMVGATALAVGAAMVLPLLCLRITMDLHWRLSALGSALVVVALTLPSLLPTTTNLAVAFGVIVGLLALFVGVWGWFVDRWVDQSQATSPQA